MGTAYQQDCPNLTQNQGRTENTHWDCSACLRTEAQAPHRLAEAPHPLAGHCGGSVVGNRCSTRKAAGCRKGRVKAPAIVPPKNDLISALSGNSRISWLSLAAALEALKKDLESLAHRRLLGRTLLDPWACEKLTG